MGDCRLVKNTQNSETNYNQEPNFNYRNFITQISPLQITRCFKI